MKKNKEFTINQLLIFACRSGNLKLIKERIKLGDDINYLDEMHGSPLLEAVKSNNTELIEFLIQNGADLKISDKHENGPVEYAIGYGNKESLKLLLDREASMVNPGRPHYRIDSDAIIIAEIF